MKLNILLLLSYLLTNLSFGQNFEGKIVYSVSYMHMKTLKKDTSLSIGLGNNEVFYIKNGDYLITGNGINKEWILYKSSTNKVYEKFRNNDTLYAIDAGINTDTILETYHYKKSAIIKDKNIKSGKTTILKCDEYIFKLSYKMEYFYFNKKYKIDTKLFSNYKLEHLADFINLSHSIPLLRNYIVCDYVCDKNAIEFIAEKLDDKLFAIPNNLIIK